MMTTVEIEVGYEAMGKLTPPAEAVAGAVRQDPPGRGWEAPPEKKDPPVLFGQRGR